MMVIPSQHLYLFIVIVMAGSIKHRTFSLVSLRVPDTWTRYRERLNKYQHNR
ncbi:hypothetical protein VCR31J2_170006 [Vibrio coralliirubri]|uniref:Uncharacterized protein n=1 Tax=Vibrio coralliirubri TaxID=1516159 RepID=A0AA86XTX8_9VIBR|nr:hypothetical protein VCR31J2_170006 [Vibrio coralliirubri]